MDYTTSSIPTSPRKSKSQSMRKIQENVNSPVQEPTAKTRRVRRPERLRKSRRRRTHVKKAAKYLSKEDEKAEVEEKIMALQQIVPGGEELVGVDKLFEKTAGYILALQLQVNFLKVLNSIVEGNEKDMKKLGG